MESSCYQSELAVNISRSADLDLLLKDKPRIVRAECTRDARLSHVQSSRSPYWQLKLSNQHAPTVGSPNLHKRFFSPKPNWNIDSEGLFAVRQQPPSRVDYLHSALIETWGRGSRQTLAVLRATDLETFYLLSACFSWSDVSFPLGIDEWMTAHYIL